MTAHWDSLLAYMLLTSPLWFVIVWVLVVDPAIEKIGGSRVNVPTGRPSRVSAGVSAAFTLVWFIIGVCVWTDVEAPVWYRIPLCAGFGLVFWFTTRWARLHC